MKILYKLYVSSIEQSGYHTVVTNSESYRVGIKDITTPEKCEKGPVERLICLESPLLSIDPEILTQIIRTNFLAVVFRTQRKAEDNL